MSDDIRGQLEVLLNEVRLLSSSFVHLRQDDFRAVFGEQVGPILRERIERFLDGQREGPGDPVLRDRLNELVGKYITTFQQNGPAAASSLLDEFERTIPRSEVIKGVERTRFVTELVEQMRDYLTLSEKVSPLPGTKHGTIGPSGGKACPLSPPAVERTLAPLASSRRVDVLMVLAEDDESLAGLSNRLAMKKGHLQFHLNVLVGAGYVTYDRKSHLYSLSTKGRRALDGLATLMDMLA